MQIIVRRTGGNNAEVVILHYGNTISLGTLGKAERIEVARQFDEASDELLSGPEMKEK